MQVNRLELKNFRNYSEQTLEFSPNINIIHGANAQGKTNLIEAVYLACSGRSHRTKYDSELIKFGSARSDINLFFSDKTRDYKCNIRLSNDKRKQICLNNIPLKKLSELMSCLNAVLFSPEDLMLVKGAPSQRRAFTDSAISQLKPAYLSTLITYYRVLEQKNSLLKQLKRSMKTSDTTLSIWNEQLAVLNADIMLYRRDFLNSMQAFAALHNIVPDEFDAKKNKENLKIIYTPSLNYDIMDKNELSQVILEKLESVASHEIENASSVTGIHRDDIAFYINGNNARNYASQGQQRSIVLVLKLALSDYIFSQRGEQAVLLLDDILSELDSVRRAYLLSNLKDRQVIITCTDVDRAYISGNDTCKYFNVKDGNII